MRIGMVGLGRMGLPVATALAEAGHAVVAVDPDPEARRRGETTGLETVERVDTSLADRQVVVLSLPGPTVVRSVCEALASVLDPAGQPGALPLVVDLSTIDPSTARAASASLEAVDVGYVDAPVLGRPDACGDWTLAMGGSADAVAEVAPVLEPVASRLVQVGEVGAGSVVKLLNNLMFGAINAVTAEVLAVSDELGVPAERFVEVLAPSRAASVSGLFREIGPRIAEGRYDDPAFTLALLSKDNRLAEQMLSEAGLQPLVARVVTTLDELAVTGGWADLDTSAMVEVYRTLLRS